MTLLRFFLTLILILLLIHFFEVLGPEEHARVTSISSDTLLALDSIRSMRMTYFNLKVQEQFWNNRIRLAREPGFILTADLRDSLITLDLQGVPVHQAHITGIQLSRSLHDSLYHASLLAWLSTPFKLLDQTATVSKEPVQERFISSRREAESQLIHLRDPEDSSYVSITLTFDRQLTLIVKESESDSVNYPLFPDIIRHPGMLVTLYISRLDALALYRALPENSSLVLNI